MNFYLDFSHLIDSICASSGLSTGDYKARIKAVAKMVRKVIFGEIEVSVYVFVKRANNRTNTMQILLPPVECMDVPSVMLMLLTFVAAIEQEIKVKLDSKGRNERRYIAKYLKEYDAFLNNPSGEEYDEYTMSLHARSKGVIAAYRAKEADCDGRATGKKRMFHDCYYLEDLEDAGSGATSTPSSNRDSSASSASASSFGSVISYASASSAPILRERLLRRDGFNPFAQPTGGMAASAVPVADDTEFDVLEREEDESQRYTSMNDEE